MKTKDYAKLFWKVGFIMLEDFFSPALMDRLNNRILEHYGTTPEFQHTDEFLSTAKVEVVPWFPQNEGPSDFDLIDANERLQNLTQAILGESWSRQYCMVMFSRKGTKGQSWHQDCPPEDSSKFNMNRLVYTMDITPELGGQTVVVPGSHKMGILPAGQPDSDMPGQVVLTPRKGTLILLHGHCWHRVLPVNGSYRVSTNYRSAPLGAPDDMTDICVYRNMRYRFSTSEIIEQRKSEKT
ncbi:MAG: phytanoyl-CoA dioxygenase family protein [Calditrichota bacterium]